jgi:isocitrate/isopropylmalate dehydrogenase
MGDGVAVFESVHGSAPDIAGQGVANPLAMIGSAALLLRHLGLTEEADRVDRAIDAVLDDGITLTPDLDGTASTAEVTDAVCKHL